MTRNRAWSTFSPSSELRLEAFAVDASSLELVPQLGDLEDLDVELAPMRRLWSAAGVAVFGRLVASLVRFLQQVKKASCQLTEKMADYQFKRSTNG